LLELVCLWVLRSSELIFEALESRFFDLLVDIGFADVLAFVDLVEVRHREIGDFQCLVDFGGVDGSDTLAVDALVFESFDNSLVILESSIASTSPLDRAVLVVDGSVVVDAVEEKRANVLTEVVDRADELEEIALGPALAPLLDDFTKQHPDVETDAELLDWTVVGNEAILTLVVHELLTNAIQHSDGSAPRITVTVDEQVASGTITVADDGPGIPKQERAVLRSGTETPLEHGSWIGLLTVQWLISRIGGHMEIRDNSPRGTAVSLSMPRDHPV